MIIKKRSETEDIYKWKVESIFATDELWQKEYDELNSEIGEFEQFRGNITKNSETLLRCLKALDKYQEKVSDIYTYAFLRFYEDTTNSFYKTMSDKAEIIMIKFGQVTSFINPELLSADEETLKQFVSQEGGLKLYDHMLDDLIRQKNYVLSEKEEKILAMTSNISKGPDSIFSMFHDADFKFDNIKDEKGNEVPLTFGNYSSHIESDDRRVRKDAYDTLYNGILEYKNTFSAIYSSSVDGDNFYADVRGYDSALEMALHGDNVSVDVYKNLISVVHDFLPEMHKYVSFRKKALGLDELKMYDMYTPIVKDLDSKTPFDKGRDTFLDAMKPLGEEYCENVGKAFTDGWIDIYENTGKRSGAFQWGTYSSNPFVLLNYHDKIDDMFTLAHELGHAMHSFYSNKFQPYVYGNYTIFLAEVASTVNEALLMEHLLKTTKDKNMKKYLLNYFLEMYKGTLFRQTMFAEFEMKTHEMAKAGEPLTYEKLSALYYELNKQYYGDDIVYDDKIAAEWARIPHFYDAFYVYKYATGFSAAMAFSKMILGGGKKELNDYLNFLKSGSSDYSLNILKKAGVDMSKPEPIKTALSQFSDLLKQMEELY